MTAHDSQDPGVPPFPLMVAGRSIAILTCMDARIDLFVGLGVGVGDAFVLRNAGGRVTADVVRSVAVCAYVRGVREFGILHHTDCGLDGVSNAELARRTGLTGVDFLPFDGLAASVREDVDALLAARVLPPDATVWGAVYDVRSAAVDLVCPPLRAAA
jgi:carbonic anhydrase